MFKSIRGLLYSSHFGAAIITASLISSYLLLHEVDIIFAIFSFFAILSSTMVGFLINDIIDIERDLINKPYRPLVTKIITKKQIKIFSFILSIIFLISIIYLLFHSIYSIYLFIYFAFYILYNYINKVSALLKNIVIAIAFILPYLFITLLLNVFYQNFFFILATFFFFLYRELLMDVNDKQGDAASGLMTVPTRVSDSTVRFIVALYWTISIWFLVLHAFSSNNLLQITLCAIIVIALAIQNLIWNNISLPKTRMRILLMSMWIPMALSIFLIKN